MKKARVFIVSLAILSLILPASGSAAFEGPTNFQADLESGTVELKWGNIENYDQQTLTRTGGLGKLGVLKKQNNPTTGQQTFSDTNNGQPFQPGVGYSYELKTTKSGETQTVSDSVLFIDSDVVIVRTLASGVVTAGYTFICRATSESNIALSWVGDLPNAPALTLYTSDTESGIRGGSRTVLAPPPALSRTSGALDHGNLTPRSTHYYWLEAGGTFYPTDPVSCTTLAAIPQDPNILQVTPLGPTSLYVTWKDNAVRAHNFVLERIKVTPATSTNVSGVRSQSGNSVLLKWKNPTNEQTYRSPYYHMIERSTDASFTGALKSFTAVFPADMVYKKGGRTDYDWTDSSPPTGAAYYRVKACSFLRVNYVGDDNPDEVCTAPTPAPGIVTIITPPVARTASIINVIENIATRAAESIGDFFSRLTGQVGAVGFASVADEAQVDLNEYFSQFAPTLTFANNPGVYRDNNLEPDTVYLYRTKTCYLNVAGTTNLGDCTSYTNEGAGKTLTSDATTALNVNVCVRNNLCGPISGSTGGKGNAPVNQCANNAACRNVGTSRQFFEETP